jgi:TPR repeat protein
MISVGVCPQLALRFYKAGALNGSAAAKVSLGTYFYMGEQLPKDLPTARQWFEAGARAGDTDGMTSLAAMLVRGEGGPRDPALASAWLTIARRLGDEKAKTMLPVVERQLDDRQRQQVAALIGKLQ